MVACLVRCVKWRFFISALGLLLVSAPGVQAAGAPADSSVALPFEAGEAVDIIQGYNGGTHQADSVYGLDLVLDDGTTSGAPVLSPIDGTVAWAFEPGTKTGCIEVLARDKKFGVMLCHVVLDRPFARGERIARGQELGTVGAAGMVGNNGTPHVHIQLQQDGRESQPVPFSAAQGGLPIEGLDLPATGASNAHGGGVDGLVSSNVTAGAPRG